MEALPYKQKITGSIPAGVFGFFNGIIFPTQLMALRSTQPLTEMSNRSTGLFISPSGISELDCATNKTDTAESIISIGRESLQVFFLY